ncbi:MAG: hypothetical protein GVY13_17455 [Alphaproteobacteria bacterium]|nr:hypothetical protein [Alphaproteobacteria bacterium]
MAYAGSGGDIGFAIPDYGVFFPPNLTPDPETGLGGWTAEEIIRAVRAGERPDGRILAPAMPWRSYAALNDADAAALAAYRQSLEPVVNPVPGPFGPRESASAPYLGLVLPGTE